MSLSPAARRRIEEFAGLSSGCLFPRVEVLKVLHDCASEMLMGSQVKEFTWIFEEGNAASPGDVRRVSSSVIRRMSCVEKIVLNGWHTVVEREDEFVELFNALPALREIHLPVYALTPTMFAALSGISTLRVVDCVIGDGDLQGEVPNRRQVVSSWRLWSESLFTSASYRNLQALSIALPDIRQAMSFVSGVDICLRRLERFEVFIAFPDGTRTDDVEKYFHNLYSRCPSLVHIVLSLYGRYRTPADVIPLLPLRVTCIFPVTQFRNLRSFRINHGLPLLMDDEDVRRLSALMPAIQSIFLNPHPMLLMKPLLTARSYFHFARQCPHLRSLGLYINLNVYLPVERDVHFAEGFHTLDVGSSPFQSPASAEGLWLVALLIATVFPRGTSIRTALEDKWLDSLEFLPTSTLGGFMGARGSILERFHEGWVAVDVMAGAFRKWSSPSLVRS